jgi:hypothetical protein
VESLACVLVLAAPLAVTCLAMAVGRCVFHPVELAAQQRELPPQYSIADFLCLFFLIQLPMALVHGYFRGEGSRFVVNELERAGPWILDAFAWFACGMMWWLSVRALSRAGIRNPWSRAIFLVVVVPVALVGALGIPIVSIAIVAGLGSLAPLSLWGLVLLELVLVGAVFGSGKYTRRIVAAAAAPPEADRLPPRVRPASVTEAGGNPFRVVAEEAESERTQ